MKSLLDSRVCIVGGGVAGVTAALHLAEKGVQVSLFDKNASLVDGPPICHLHAGGNLYREIDLEQCVELLQQSIETVRLYPHTLNPRPTVIAIPRQLDFSPDDIISRANCIRQSYQKLVDEDPLNQVLGDPADYYRCYSKPELENLARQTAPQNPKTMDEWVIAFAKNTNLDSIKFPVLVVNEYGWSVFRLAATAELSLRQLPSCELKTSTKVVSIESVEFGYNVTFSSSEQLYQTEHFDFLINACGFKTGELDNQIHESRQRIVEFKAAYVSKWDTNELWPEVVFIGERGTPQGMAQFTPYPNGIVQLHGMTKDITLFEAGLVSSELGNAQPKLPGEYQSYLSSRFDPKIATQRGRRAIEYMANYIESFRSADAFDLPLFGAQQIPGDDPTLRSSTVSFVGNRYARMEIVKGSSALKAAKEIYAKWGCEHEGSSIEEQHQTTVSFSEREVEAYAAQLCEQRGYPKELALVYG